MACKINPTIDYYGLLGLGSTATEAEITQAYRRRILQVHLDKLPAGQDTEICYQTIEAYRILSTKQLRTKYDILRDTELQKNQRELTDGEILEKYKNKYSSDGLPQIAQLRIRYEIERLLAEKFKMPVCSGAICYDVGEAQLSRAISQRISSWKSEFNESKFSDNYFESLSQVFGQVLDSAAQKSESSSSSTNCWNCNLCDESFLDSAEHWTRALLPYINYLSTDSSSSVNMNDYFALSIGPLYSWEPRYLPPRPSGIWGCTEFWESFPKIQAKVNRIILKEMESDFTTKHSKLGKETEYIQWVLENQSSNSNLLDKAGELLCEDKLDELLLFACIVKETLPFTNWNSWIYEAMASCQMELAMFWTMFGNLIDEPVIPTWFELGMSIHSEGDPLLAHFCFLIGGYGMEEIANIFAHRGNLFAAAEWYLNCGRADVLLEKSRPCSQPCSSKTVHNDDPFYGNVYYCVAIKKLLRTLKYESQPSAAQLEQLVEFMLQVCPENSLFEGFKILVTAYPKAMVGCPAIHRTIIGFLKERKLDFSTLNLILAAYHFLPSDEFDADFLRMESSRLMKKELERCVKSCDFESLTDALLNLGRRNLTAAESVLKELFPSREEDTEANAQDSTPNHAMKLLIQGTVHRVNSNWLDSMSDYQNALLSTPECLYRLVPCVSKLTQNDLFHESVLNQVQSEVKQLKEFFDFQEYVEIDSAVDSLVVSDPVPAQEFGYQEKTNRLQQLDPEQLKAQPVQQTPIETNTPLVTMTKNEKAIESVNGGGSDEEQALSAAYAYMDLIKALPTKSQNGPTVMAASHLLRAMESSEDTSNLFAYRNAIYMMAESLFKLQPKSSSSVQSCLSHKHMFSIILMANQRLSRVLRKRRSSLASTSTTDSIQQQPQFKVSAPPTSEDKMSTEDGEEMMSHLISRSDSALISEFLESIVHFPKIEPLVNIPTLNCSDLQYVETIWNQFMLQYCRDKVAKPSGTKDSHLQAFALFTEIRQGRGADIMDFERAKEKATQSLLAAKGQSVEDVEKLLQWPCGQFTNEGWTDVEKVRLKFPDEQQQEMSFKSIDGFQIDYETCEISFLFSYSEDDEQTDLIRRADIVEIFENGIEEFGMNFENPDSHPCQQIKMTGALHGTEAFKTMLRVAMLINNFAAGVELNAKTPFYIRNAQLGLMSRLPEHLQYFCRPLRARVGRSTKNLKFWLNVLETYFEDQIESNSNSSSVFTYKIGSVETKISTANNEKEGCLLESSDTAAIQQFAQDFTRNYDEIGIYFPELLRLKELYKISIICKKLREILEENSLLIAQNGRSEEETARLSQICSAIRDLGITSSCKESSSDTRKEFKSAWIPSIGCHNIFQNAEEIVGGGVKMDTEPVFGPVSCRSNGVTISADDLFEKVDKIETEITVELKSQKSHQYSNIIKEALAEKNENCWWTPVAPAPTTAKEADAAEREGAEPDLEHVELETPWRYVQRSEELYYNGTLIYKFNNRKLEPNKKLDIGVGEDHEDLADRPQEETKLNQFDESELETNSDIADEEFDNAKGMEETMDTPSQKNFLIDDQNLPNGPMEEDIDDSDDDSLAFSKEDSVSILHELFAPDFESTDTEESLSSFEHEDSVLIKKSDWLSASASSIKERKPTPFAMESPDESSEELYSESEETSSEVEGYIETQVKVNHGQQEFIAQFSKNYYNVEASSSNEVNEAKTDVVFPISLEFCCDKEPINGQYVEDLHEIFVTDSRNNRTNTEQEIFIKEFSSKYFGKALSIKTDFQSTFTNGVISVSSDNSTSAYDDDASVSDDYSDDDLNDVFQGICNNQKFACDEHGLSSSSLDEDSADRLELEAIFRGANELIEESCSDPDFYPTPSETSHSKSTKSSNSLTDVTDDIEKESKECELDDTGSDISEIESEESLETRNCNGVGGDESGVVRPMDEIKHFDSKSIHQFDDLLKDEPVLIYYKLCYNSGPFTAEITDSKPAADHQEKQCLEEAPDHSENKLADDEEDNLEKLDELTNDISDSEESLPHEVDRNSPRYPAAAAGEVLEADAQDETIIVEPELPEESAECLIHKGVYSISKSYTDPNKGPLTMELKLISRLQPTLPEVVETEESSNNNNNNKSQIFYIHGTNRNHNYEPETITTCGTNGEIGIILPSNIRKRISSSAVKTFLVE